MNKNVLWITRSAVFTALLIVTQLTTAAFGNQFVTGPLVNLILIVAVSLCGLKTGLTVAVISHVFAKLIGIGPFWALVPFIALGNITLVLVWHYIGNREFKYEIIKITGTILIAAFLKFIVVYLGAVKIAVPFLLELPEAAAAAVSATFSVTQFFTASIGGLIAAAILPVLKKALKDKNYFS